MRSAWLKWARGVEHQKVLARATREFVAGRTLYMYERTDNSADSTDPLVRMHWRLRDLPEYPERWSILLGDIVTNLRAALDHAFWAAAVRHSGVPTKPHVVNFPITPVHANFDSKGILRRLVADDVWEIVEAVQPFHGGDQAHTTPLEVLRWLSNVDKHRAVHVVNCVAVDLGSLLLDSAPQAEVVDEYRKVGPVKDGDVVARLKLKRTHGDAYSLDLTPAVGFSMSIPISEHPEEHRNLHSTMETIRDAVSDVLAAISACLDAPVPDGLDLGAEHDSIAEEFAGDNAIVRDADGNVHHINLNA